MYEKYISRGGFPGDKGHPERKEMKVLLLTTHLNLGGIGIYTLLLASALKRSGIHTVVASSGGCLEQELISLGIEHIRIPVHTSMDIGFHTIKSYYRLRPIIRDQGIDIIHAQTRVTQVIACLLAKKTHTTFVATCHGFFKNKWFRRVLPCWGDHTLAISDPVRQHLVCDLKVAKERISLIFNGIDIKQFHPLISADHKSHIKKQFNLNQGPVIGIISRLSSVKGHRYLLKAFKRISDNIPEAQLLVVGDGSDRYIKDLKIQADDLGISEMVRFHPACRDTATPLSIMDVFCHPSLQEGLGLSILEAMAMGLPVVASDVGGIYTLIKHRFNGLLVPSMDYNALADSVLELLSNPDMARKMGARSRDIVEKQFTVDKMRDQVIEAYNKAAKK
jgi:glycosyltransferase involved in cell wall biosynthesis